MKERLIAFGRACFAWDTWGQRLRTTFLVIALALLCFWLDGVLSVYFYRPKHMITLSGNTNTQCVGRYLIDVPNELGQMGSGDIQLFYGLSKDFKTVDAEVKRENFTQAQFESAVQARLDDLKRRKNDWGTSKLLAQEVITTPYGRALLLRFLTSSDIDARIDSELHTLLGSRYVLLKGKSYHLPDPEPTATKEKPMYTYIDPKPAEDRLRKVAMNIKGYTDATKAPEGFCVSGVVFNDKTMGYDIETAGFSTNTDPKVLPDVSLSISMEGQYVGRGEGYETLFQRVNKVSPVVRAELASGGGQLMVLRHNTPKINGMPAREYGHAIHINNKVMFNLQAETALEVQQQSIQRPYFNFDFEVGSPMEEKTSPLTEEQTLKVWDGLLKSMRLSPANGGARIDDKTGGLVPETKVGQDCPKSGVWSASLPNTHPSARNLANYNGRFKTVQLGEPMPEMYSSLMFPHTADADNAAITWTWVREA